MRFKSVVGFVLFGLVVFNGCANRVLISYDQVEKTNWLEVTLTSGIKIEGTVVKTEPHQIILLQKNKNLKEVDKASIRSIKRKPPVYDDLGAGISEEEIQSERTNRNTYIYGIGGGALSLGVSFFASSLISQNMANEGSTILAATTAVGGGLGTYFFIKAGKAMDRKQAIERIQEKRRSAELKQEQEKMAPDDLQKQIEIEKQKQEELRKQREALLRELEGKKKKNKEE